MFFKTNMKYASLTLKGVYVYRLYRSCKSDFQKKFDKAITKYKSFQGQEPQKLILIYKASGDAKRAIFK